MRLKNIFKKILKSKNTKIESNDSYCYSNIVWNSKDNLIILISFSEDYFEQVIEIQDAVNNSANKKLATKIVYSSYDEETGRKDEDGNDIIIIHKKHYMLIGGSPSSWSALYMNISNLGNDILYKISDEIVNNRDNSGFKDLIDDDILRGFDNDNISYDIDKESKNEYFYTDPDILLKRLPNSFTGRDVIKFILIYSPHDTISSAYSSLFDVIFMPDALFKNHHLYPLYSALFKDPTIAKLNTLLEPLYKQPDDDSVPGDISDDALDDIFKEHYERFSAVADNSIHYEDIDEELSDDEESENMRKEDMIE